MSQINQDQEFKIYNEVYFSTILQPCYGVPGDGLKKLIFRSLP